MACSIFKIKRPLNGAVFTALAFMIVFCVSCASAVNQSAKLSLKPKDSHVESTSQAPKEPGDYRLYGGGIYRNPLMAGERINQKTFMDAVSPLYNLGDWGYVDHEGFLMLDSYFKNDSPFFIPEQKNFYEFSPSYFGAWWKNFVESIK